MARLGLLFGIDGGALPPVQGQAGRELLEMLEEGSGARSTVRFITSRLPPPRW